MHDLTTRVHHGRVSEEHSERIEAELEWAAEAGVAGDLLALADVARNLREDGHLLAPGHFGMGSSVLLWALEVAAVDPVKSGLTPSIFLPMFRKRLATDGRWEMAASTSRDCGRVRVRKLPALARIRNVVKRTGIRLPDVGFVDVRVDAGVARRLSKRLGVDIRYETFDDLVAAWSLDRPGPKEGGLHTAWADAAPAQPEDVVEAILQRSRGFIIYQEQVADIGRQIMDLGVEEGNRFYRELCRKQFSAWRGRWFERSEPILGQARASEWWSTIECWASYTFSQAHSNSEVHLLRWAEWWRLAGDAAPTDA